MFSIHFPRLPAILLPLTVMATQTAAAAEPIMIPHENVSDLRGVLNAFHLFREACTRQPVSPDLPAQLVPDGYRVVTRTRHWEMEDTGTSNNAAILSKTGTEQGDWDGGHPFVDLSMPSEANPDGGCAVYWKRGWDYSEGQERIARGLYAALPSYISYHLSAILRTPPTAVGMDGPVYVETNDWITWCWDGRMCAFRMIYEFDVEDGIDMTITRREVER